MSDQQEVLGLEEAAKALAVHRSTVIRMVRSGQLEGSQKGLTWRISSTSVAKAKAAKAREKPE